MRIALAVGHPRREHGLKRKPKHQGQALDQTQALFACPHVSSEPFAIRLMYGIIFVHAHFPWLFSAGVLRRNNLNRKEIELCML